MKGKILGYDKLSQTGIIVAENGVRYNFAKADWCSPTEPMANANVDFELMNDYAVRIYHIKSSSFNLDKKWIATLLAFFFGSVGAHKFYLGYTKQGIIMLVAFIFGFILLGIPSLIVFIIGFIEAILYLSKDEELFDETYVANERPWF